MFTKKTLSVVLFGAILLALGATAAGQGRAARIARLKDYLALTDTQAGEIAALLKKHQEAAFPLRQQVRSKNQELRSALDAPEPDPTAVGQLVIAKQVLNKQLRAMNAKLTRAIGAVLTPEQRQKFQRLRALRGRRSGREQAWLSPAERRP
ncbi:MAG TPA: periplasmic heavy metal sensor [Blastocatellia bacterium]|nr:periplasmic heavy metal sensor [Blastocatellia bacterium]